MSLKHTIYKALISSGEQHNLGHEVPHATDEGNTTVSTIDTLRIKIMSPWRDNITSVYITNTQHSTNHSRLCMVVVFLMEYHITWISGSNWLDNGQYPALTTEVLEVTDKFYGDWYNFHTQNSSSRRRIAFWFTHTFSKVNYVTWNARFSEFVVIN